MLAATVLLIFLSQEIKKSYIAAITLFAYLLILIVHVAQIATLSEEFRYMTTTLSRCIAIDFVFILISFFSYLWVDDIETKVIKIKDFQIIEESFINKIVEKNK